MTMLRIKGSATGFSLLEVLVAVVIVSVGLVALAALQLSLIRSSNTSKMQSTALSLAKQQIEKLRSFRSLAEYDALTDSTVTGDCSSSPTVNCIGNVPYSVQTTITRYVLNGATYALVGDVVSQAALRDDATQHYVVGRDFKKATVTVTWNDATGASNTLALDDVVDGIDPVDSAKVAQNSSSLATRPVQVVINNPSGTPGVIAIPLATGDSVDTAATNPKPVIDSNATETRFNIYTYAGLSGGKALAQSEVETVLIGCTCDTAAAPTDSSTRGYRPTYWNGFRYVAPKLATYAPPAGQYTSKKVDESPYCDVCCRDHNDPVGITTAKFSPFRTTHTHYGLANDGVTLVPVGTNGQTIYKEACRLIRTDGILRVAADYNDEYFNLLKTKNDGSSTEYAPDATATTNYQNFVLDYLNAKVVSPLSSSAYNTPVAAATVSTLEGTRNINDPASITLQRSNDHKWLHSRGLYVDYLEPEALQAIDDAKANCVATSCTAAAKQTAVLELLPFTSINLTELTAWFPLVSNSQYVSISNGAFTSSTAYNGSAPVRGYVVPATSGIPATPQTQNGTSTARNSNSGLQTLFDVAINNDEGSKSDTQVFAIPAGNTTNGGNFSVTFSSYGFPRSAAPTLSGSNVTNCTSVKSGSSYSSACGSTNIGGGATLNVTNYNSQSSNTSNIATGVSVTCTKSDGSSPISVLTTTANRAKVYTCSNYQITSATNTTSGVAGSVGSVTGDGTMAEVTPVSFPAIGNNDVLNLTFGTPTTSYGYKCTYTTSSSDAKIIAATCP
jgi:type IV pilus modification protein PilV